MHAHVHTHVITGWPDQVNSALHRAHTDGRLVGFTDVVPLANGHVQVTAGLRHPQKPRPRQLSNRTWTRIGIAVLGAALAAGIACAVLALISTLIATVASVIAVVAAWLATYSPALAVIALGGLLLAARGANNCAGLHCGGCRR